MKSNKNRWVWILATVLVFTSTAASAHHGCRGMHRGFYGRGYYGGGYYAPYRQVVPPPVYYAPPPPVYYAPPPPVCRPRVYAPRPHRGWRRFGW
ncbi:MAG: hypothetical protein U0T84_13630 [Chitinophagales bacterium]